MTVPLICGYLSFIRDEMDIGDYLCIKSSWQSWQSSQSLLPCGKSSLRGEACMRTMSWDRSPDHPWSSPHTRQIPWGKGDRYVIGRRTKQIATEKPFLSKCHKFMRWFRAHQMWINLLRQIQSDPPSIWSPSGSSRFPSRHMWVSHSWNVRSRP